MTVYPSPDNYHCTVVSFLALKKNRLYSLLSMSRIFLFERWQSNFIKCFTISIYASAKLKPSGSHTKIPLSKVSCAFIPLIAKS